MKRTYKSDGEVPAHADNPLEFHLIGTEPRHRPYLSVWDGDHYLGSIGNKRTLLRLARAILKVHGDAPPSRGG